LISRYLGQLYEILQYEYQIKIDLHQQIVNKFSSQYYRIYCLLLQMSKRDSYCFVRFSNQILLSLAFAALIGPNKTPAV
ncbi:TPA: hypothetical protein ACQM00_001648, partial [Streptococcus pyogenes]